MNYLVLLHCPELYSGSINTVTSLRTERFGPTNHPKVWDPQLYLGSTEQTFYALPQPFSAPLSLYPKPNLTIVFYEAICILQLHSRWRQPRQVKHRQRKHRLLLHSPLNYRILFRPASFKISQCRKILSAFTMYFTKQLSVHWAIKN